MPPRDDGSPARQRAPERAARTARLTAWVLWAGLALAGAVLLAAVALLWYERGKALGHELDRSELLARVLEDHATRSVETVAVALSALSDVLARTPAGNALQLGETLTQALSGLPLLRGAAVLDSQGRVLASTVPGEVGLAVELSRLGPLPTVGRDRLGPFVPGRGLGALAAASGAPAAPRGVGFLPLVRNIESAQGQGLLLVGLINPDAIANHQEQTLTGERGLALLAGLDGKLLAGTREVRQLPGEVLPPLPVFTQYLPNIEFRGYIGQGLGSGTQLVAFRASRTRPLVVVVEKPQVHALAIWAEGARLVAALAGVAAMVIVAMTLAAARSLRAREAAQAEVAFRERELSVIVKSVQELIFRTDAEGRLTFVNARWQAATGTPEAQALGMLLPSLVHPDDRAGALALFAASGSGGLRSCAARMGSGAAVRRFELAVAPLRGGSGIVGFAGSAVDVTERWAAQRRLQQQLVFNELMIETLPLPLSMLDLDGRYVIVNQAWEAFTGRSRQEVIGTPARDRLPPDEAALHEARDRELLASRGQLRYESTMRRRDGSRCDLAITKACVLGEDGRPAGILVTFMDITEVRGAERATREARDAAEEASRAKSEFIANISHELRTPLQSIIGFSELGQARSGEQLRLAGMFGDIHKSGHRMLALVNDLLDVSKIESTVGTFHLERTDLRPLVREVVRELEPLLGPKQLRVELALSEGPLVAKVDPTRFQQVVRNVLANAIRFSPPGQAIDIGGDILVEDSQIEIVVRDRGPGIPPAELEKIFEAFVQSSKTKDGSGGTGLGLAICRKIVEAQGGRIVAGNMPDVGSIFRIRLPARGFNETQPGEI